jgi:para-nitrobenzyl esterase
LAQLSCGPASTTGFSLYALFTPAQLELSHQMVEYWVAFVKTGSPNVTGQPGWPQYRTHRLMSLRPDDQSETISNTAFAAQDQCSFWNDPGAAHQG